MNKDRILKPYEQNKDGNYVRYSLSGVNYGVIYKAHNSDIFYSSEHWKLSKPGNAIPFFSLEEAMLASDQEFIKKGFTVLTKEQLDKFTLLF